MIFFVFLSVDVGHGKAIPFILMVAGLVLSQILTDMAVGFLALRFFGT